MINNMTELLPQMYSRTGTLSKILGVLDSRLDVIRTHQALLSEYLDIEKMFKDYQEADTVNIFIDKALINYGLYRRPNETNASLRKRYYVQKLMSTSSNSINSIRAVVKEAFDLEDEEFIIEGYNGEYTYGQGDSNNYCANVSVQLSADIDLDKQNEIIATVEQLLCVGVSIGLTGDLDPCAKLNEYVYRDYTTDYQGEQFSVFTGTGNIVQSYGIQPTVTRALFQNINTAITTYSNVLDNYV